MHALKKLGLIAIITVFIWNCRQQEKEKNHESLNKMQVTETNKGTPKLEKGCYKYDQHNSIVLFEIDKTTPSVSGNLMYQLDEKDKNTGRFEGIQKKDTLIGTYTFMSEGIESTREVAFKVLKGQLIEGYGTMNEEGTAFKSYDSIKFSSTMPLTKTDCDL